MYYVYEKTSTLIIGKPDSNGVARPDHRHSYKTMAAAKAGLTRICKAEGLLATDPNYALYRYAIAESAYFHKNIEKQRTVKNMITGEDFTEAVNTPAYMSPSRESYWSM